MNILRMKRKSKKKLRLKRYLLLIFAFIMTTFAWFAYSKVLETDTTLNLIPWDIKFFVNGVEQSNPLNLAITEMYPAMDDQNVNVTIQNNGQVNTIVQYEIDKIFLLGTEYNIVSDPSATLEDTDLLITSPTVENGVSTQSIINDTTRFPFKVDIETTAEMAALGEGYVKVNASWQGDNDELDTKWGYDVGKYYEANPATAQPLKIILKVYAIQKEE